MIVLCFDEPALVRVGGAPEPLVCELVGREFATDILSTALAAPACLTAVHVCGLGDVRLALDAGPRLVHFDSGVLDLDDAVTLSRFLEGGGWVIWGAIPTDRPVGEHAAPIWKALLDVWCELTRRGCDPSRLRSQALVRAGVRARRPRRESGGAHDAARP